MHPILLQLGAFRLHSYGLCMALGILSAWFFLVRLARRRGFDETSLGNLVVGLVVAGLAGARLFYVCEHWTVQFSADPASALRIWEGGLMFYGSVIVGGIALVAWCAVRKRSVVEHLDLFAAVVPLGQAFGRVGCFLNGCCHGEPTDGPFGVSFPRNSLPFLEQLREGRIDLFADRSLPVHPTQLYEAAACLLLFAFLLWLHRRLNPELGPDGRPADAPDAPRTPWPGAVSAGYLIGYAAIRFFDETLRADERMRVGPFSISQAISLGCLALGLGFLFSLALSRRRRLSLPSP